MKLLSIVGARPNFMKVAPIHRAAKAAGIDSFILHTGQHYDERMSDIFFRQLGLPEPHAYLGVGGGSHAVQTARIMTAFEDVLLREAPDLVLVVGDVNSTLACSLVAVKCHIPVAHVEAGLRSGDRRMPEEINRLVTDSISDYLFVSEPSGVENLNREGAPEERIFFVGNVMIDSLCQFRDMAARSSVLNELGLIDGEFVLMTMHRPSNVDEQTALGELVRIITKAAERMPVVFPVHPRTRSRLEEFGWIDDLNARENVRFVEPVGYVEFLRLMEGAALVVTDSGGIQEETTFLGVPCLTLRENTERPITIEMGTNELLSLDADVVTDRINHLLAHGGRDGVIPPLWDGRAAERIVEILVHSTVHPRAAQAARPLDVAE